MIEHIYRVLGYFNVLDTLSHYTTCQPGESDCLSLKPLNDPEQIENELKLVSEIRLLLKTRGFVSLSHVADVIPLVEKSAW